MFTNRPPRSAGIQAKMLTIILPLIAAPMLILAGVGFFTANREAANSSARYLAQREADLRAATLGDHVLLSSMLADVGINRSTVNWVKGPTFADRLRLFVEGKADAYMAFAPLEQELRAKKIGRVIVVTAQDRPWSQYYCCVAIGHRDFVRAHPVATKRALRALLKATDLCAQRPEQVARVLAEKGYEARYDRALEVLKSLPYDRWRNANAEDTLRFHANRLYEVGMIKTPPNKLISQGADWRFLNELKKELKA